MSNKRQPGAMRFNKGKPELSFWLDFPHAMDGVSRVAAMGAEKYARDNHMRGLDFNVLIDSMIRHLVLTKAAVSQHKLGNISDLDAHEVLLDDESTVNHLYHVAWNAIVLAEQYGHVNINEIHKKIEPVQQQEQTE